MGGLDYLVWLEVLSMNSIRLLQSLRFRVAVLLGVFVLMVLAALFVGNAALANEVGLLRARSTAVNLLAEQSFVSELSLSQFSFAAEELMMEHALLIDSVNGFFAASNSVEPDEFAAFVSSLDGLPERVWLTSFVPYVTDRSSFEQLVVDRGFSGFSIKELSESGDFVSASRRDFYLPLDFVLSSESADEAFGFDLVFDGQLLPFFEEARDFGRVVLSSSINFGWHPSDTIWLIDPVYHNGVLSDTVESRRASLQGFIVLGVSVSEYVAEVLEDSGVQAVVLSTRDVTGGQSEVLYSAEVPSLASSVIPVEFLGREWEFEIDLGFDEQSFNDEIVSLSAAVDSTVIALGEGSEQFSALSSFNNSEINAAYARLVAANQAFQADVRSFLDAENVDEDRSILVSLAENRQKIFDGANEIVSLLVEVEEGLFSQFQQLLTLRIVILVVVFGVGAFVLNNFLTRLRKVREASVELSGGSLEVRVPFAGNDELGVIASGLNALADRLEGTLASLQEQVQERTRDFQAVADVNAQIATILDPQRLLADVADLVKERFRLYHAHIYLLEGEALLLSAGAGMVGRQMIREGHAIQLYHQTSIVAQIARSRRSVVVNDVAASPTFLPNRLLPDTRAELAVPLIARGQVLGVLDVQSDKVGFFDEDTLGVIELLAGQIAIALSNARLFDYADRTSRYESALGNIDRTIQGAVDMDEILKVTVRELGKALRVRHTAIQLQLPSERTVEQDHVIEGAVE